MPTAPDDIPGIVTAGRRRVYASWPGGTEDVLTSEAALETAERLTEAAIEAKGREVWRDC